MKKIIVLNLMLLQSLILFSQDYYDDANGEGLPIHVNANGSLFSSRVNVKDNSIKINFFTFFKSREIYSDETVPRNTVGTGTVLPNRPADPQLPKATTRWGTGINIKGKTEQNFGSLFSSGVFAPGFVGGAYAAHRKVNIRKDPDDATKNLASFRTLLFSGQYSTSSLRLYDNTRVFEKMKIDTAFNGYSFGVSWFKTIAVDKTFSDAERRVGYKGRTGFLIFGASLEFARKNNYNTLDQYEVKDYFVQIVDPTSSMTRTIQIADDEGYGYSRNDFSVYNSIKFRPHINYVPGLLNNRIGTIFYPSIEFIENDDSRLNFGLGIHILEKGIPSLSTAGVFFEFNDVYNNRDIKNKTFLQRSFNVSIGASFNMFTGKQR